MFVLWLAAAASSSYSCDDLCNACAGAGDVNYNSQYCVCSVVNDSFENAFKRSYSPNSRGLLEGRGPRSHNSRSSSQSPDAESRSANAAKKAFDAIMTCVLALHVSDLGTDR